MNKRNAERIHTGRPEVKRATYIRRMHIGKIKISERRGEFANLPQKFPNISKLTVKKFVTSQNSKAPPY